MAFIKPEILGFIFSLFGADFTAAKSCKYFADVMIIFSQESSIADANVKFCKGRNVIVKGAHALGEQ